MNPLAIVQARMGSTRFPGKVMKPIAGETLVQRVCRLTALAVGRENTVVAYPRTNENRVLREHLDVLGVQAFPFDGEEGDVLARFHACAHHYRWHPDTVILRVTADDPFKDPTMMRRVIAGERLPVALGGEAFTLAMLDHAHFAIDGWHDGVGDGLRNARRMREHLSYAMFDTPPPPPPASPIPWSIDSEADYWAVVDTIAGDHWPRKHD